jgi:hypothetical protein
LEQPEWLIQDLIAEKSTTMVYGPWGLGKSFMVLDMVLTATTGADWYGDRRIARPLKTLYVVAEGVAWWPRRILAYERGRGEFDADNILWIPEPVNLWTPSGRSDIPALELIIQEHNPDLLVFDTWVRCTAAFGMNEDKATDTAQVFRELDRIRDKYSVSPIIVHHPTKSGNFRGSGNQGASLERIIELREVKDHSEMVDVYDEKGNHTEPFTPFRLRFESIPVDIDATTGEDITSAVLRFEGSLGTRDPSTNAQKVVSAAVAVYAPGDEFTFADLGRISSVPTGSMSAAVAQAVSMGYMEKAKAGVYRLTVTK